MPASRRPQPGRRPPASARSGRRRTTPADRPTQPPRPAPPRSGGLTTRAAILGLVLCALVVSAALPLREFIAQRGAIDALAARQAAQRQRIAALEEQRRRLDDPVYVAALVRQRLHFVRPGETAYILLVPSASPSAAGLAASEAGPVGPEAPWYSQLWGSIRSADRPVPLPRPTPAPSRPAPSRPAPSRPAP